ncbi:serine/threonine-protein kinase nim1 [Plakobranchus ocellatus]|uniref:Serine/threonine-protein kinase NIM1 n=1 Tax=Plakobranchus ocellatus TaxID=259542 RepID=A0AAV3ZNC2_9GAST|nr:serine/threonine-protein kinase nim1 [Plakobranchus ocellatus]
MRETHSGEEESVYLRGSLKEQHLYQHEHNDQPQHQQQHDSSHHHIKQGTEEGQSDRCDNNNSNKGDNSAVASTTMAVTSATTGGSTVTSPADSTINSFTNRNNNNQQQLQQQYHHYHHSHSVPHSQSFSNGTPLSATAGERTFQPLSARDGREGGRRPPTPPGSRLLHRSSTEPSVSEHDSGGYPVRVTPYERLSSDLANDPRIMKEITLGRRIAFYRIRGEIGTGNFSQVKLGIHVLTKEKVAIKILDKTKLDQKTQRLLSREITSMERLHHPNVIRLYEVVETLAKLHIIMEYAGGGELFTKISNEGRLPEDEAKCLFAQLVAAVDHIHENNIIHRDLKAENVFYASPRWIKIGDFGFSTVARIGETLNTFCGSPPYAAPELFKDEHYYGVFVDVWALGILLYFMVTGLMPFRAETVAKLKKCILDGSYTVPSYVSDSCVFLIRSILKHIPQDRFTIAEIKRSEWLEGQEFPGALDAYKLNPSADTRDINGEEREARSILENLGIKEDHFRQSSIKDSRSSITGTYRIVLHRVQKKTAGLPDAAQGAMGMSGSVGGSYDSPEVTGREAAYSMTAVERRRGKRVTPNSNARSVGSKPQSKTCNIL